MSIAFVISPLVGTLVGYVTNDIAIRMLFRPLAPVYLFGRRLPLTPGIIPRNRARLAHQVGQKVASKLVSCEVLSSKLLSDDVVARVHSAALGAFDGLARNHQPLADVMAANIGESRTNEVVDGLSSCLSDVVVTHLAENHVASLGVSLGGLIGFDVRKQVANVVRGLFRTPMSEIVSRTPCLEPRAVADVVVDVFRRVVVERLPQVLEHLDVAGLVEERINAMDVREVEALVRDVVDHELKAIVWFGAGLGFLMGLASALLNSVF